MKPVGALGILTRPGFFDIATTKVVIATGPCCRVRPSSSRW
jgi:hypothetical protein